jgi:hypothetical protein
MKTYINEYDDNVDLIPPGVYSVQYKPHYNGSEHQWMNTPDSVVVKLTKQTSQNKMAYWIKKQICQSWVSPRLEPATCTILGMSRLDK